MGGRREGEGGGRERGEGEGEGGRGGGREEEGGGGLREGRKEGGSEGEVERMDRVWWDSCTYVNLSNLFSAAFILVNGEHSPAESDEDFEIIDWPPVHQFVSTPRFRGTPPRRGSDFSDLTDTIN